MSSKLFAEFVKYTIDPIDGVFASVDSVCIYQRLCCNFQSTQRVWHASHNADMIVSDIEGLKYLHAPTHSLSHLTITFLYIVIINEKWNKMIVEYITGFINKEKQDECT